MYFSTDKSNTVSLPKPPLPLLRDVPPGNLEPLHEQTGEQGGEQKTGELGKVEGEVDGEDYEHLSLRAR